MFSGVVTYVQLFFVFKQKTAYDMRISDWSSDVCSSDLSAFSPRPQNLAATSECGTMSPRELGGAAILSGKKSLAEAVADYGAAAKAKLSNPAVTGEIGQASCRE